MIRKCDVVVVGAGAAGLTAAIVRSRARADVLVIHDGKPRNAPAAHQHGFVSRELDRVRPEYNGVRLHAGSGRSHPMTNTKDDMISSDKPAVTGSTAHTSCASRTVETRPTRNR